MRTPTTRILVSIFCLAFALSPASAKEWTRFRGPDGSGISNATTIPVNITEKHYNWNVELPGSGHASPVIWGDRIFLTSVDREEGGVRYVTCLSTKDGSVIWNKKETFNAYRQHKFNSYASSTAAVDAERVYITWTSPSGREAIAFDHDGNEKWRKNLGSYKLNHGSSTSPVVIDGVVMIGNEHEAANAFIVGLDAKSGKELWRLKRDTASKGSFATPTIYRPSGGKAQAIFASTAHGLTAVDPKSGKIVWSHDPDFSQRCVSSPVISGDVIFTTCGQGGGGKDSVAVKPDGKKTPKALYQITRRIPYVPTGVGYKDHFYIINDAGLMVCIRAKDGEVLWEERVTGPTYSSPICVNGYLYCISREGEMGVLKATNMFDKVHTHKFPEAVNATPAVSGGKMYVRTTNRLISIGG